MIDSVKSGALMQGGSFRLDLGPTKAEIDSFRLAVVLYDECRKAGKQTKLGCIINDFALPPQARPKATGRLEFPQEYLQILRAQNLIDEGARLEQIRPGKGGAVIFLASTNGFEIRIFYESSLRNAARKDARSVLKVNFLSGIEVPACPAIMGKFYSILAKAGFSQHVGFFAKEDKPCDDNSCSIGPTLGARRDMSGYEPEIPIINWYISSDGRIMGDPMQRVAGVR